MLGEALPYLESRRQVDPNSGCWLWDGAPGAGGYGVARFRGRYYKAHRLSWLAHRGEIPDGLKVLHWCDTPPCTNPAHLFLGTQADNVADMVAKGRQRSVPRYGSASHYAVLTEQNVWVIRNLIDIDVMPQREIARLWSVSPMTISRIANWQSWPHVSLDWDRETVERVRRYGAEARRAA